VRGVRVLNGAPRLAGLGLLTALLAGCYTYRPLLEAPAPETKLSLVLSDQGRVGAAKQVGPQVSRVEGDLIAASDSAYVVAVSSVRAFYRPTARWNGETVNLRRDYVSAAYEKRFSRGRTALLLGSVATTLVTVIVSQHIFGIGADRPPNVPPGGGGDGQ
jgi:hypothetical protein